jgi:hypothetical protein
MDPVWGLCIEGAVDCVPQLRNFLCDTRRLDEAGRYHMAVDFP